MLIIFEAHPVPYHAPVFRALQQDFNVPVHVIYGSDFSIAGYLDEGFATRLSWDHTLLEGYSSQFLSRVSEGGAKNYDEVSSWGMTKAADAQQGKAVLSIGYYARYDLSGIGYALRRGLPLLFRGETNDEAHMRLPVYDLFRTLYLRKLYARCAGMLYIGQRSKEHFLRFGAPENKLFFSPYCVDERYFDSPANSSVSNRANIRKELGIPSDACVILFSGKLSKKKGVDLLPQAIRSLPSEWRSRLHLLVVGDGPLREGLAAQCASSPSIPVSFAGFQGQDTLASFYQASDLLVLPSRERETWGVVVNEALINGLPCVVSDRVGCQPDLIEPGITGEICPPNDAKGLSEALLRLLVQIPERKFSDHCRERARHYSVANAAKGIAEAWSSLDKR